jgi:hypothetical protein
MCSDSFWWLNSHVGQEFARSPDVGEGTAQREKLCGVIARANAAREMFSGLAQVRLSLDELQPGTRMRAITNTTRATEEFLSTIGIVSLRINVAGNVLPQYN